MKVLQAVVVMMLLSFSSHSQTATDIISRVLEKQSTVANMSYSIQVIDTFTSGDVWNLKGKSQIQNAPTDTALGFYFWAKRDDFPQHSLYDGRTAYDINDEEKTYRITSNPQDIPHVFGSPGGQMVFRNLIKLDTSYAKSFELTQTDTHYLLTFRYADNDEYNVVNRYKTIWIRKATLLPDAEKSHLVALGRVQDKYYKVSDLKVNETLSSYLHSDNSFLTEYSQEVPPTKGPLLAMIGKDAPQFDLASFAGGRVTSKSFSDKVVLLDFWAVWCGPCVASMPKVQSLYEKYKNKGLAVYGILCDSKDLEPAKLLLKKQNISLHMLTGNEQVQKDYKLNAVPLYVVINKKGKVSFVSEGYTDQLEVEIKRALGD